MAELARVERGELITRHGSGDAEPLPAERNPAAVYLAGLGSERARRAMLGRLRYIAGLSGSSAKFRLPVAAGLCQGLGMSGGDGCPSGKDGDDGSSKR
jgi:hypothetical protein